MNSINKIINENIEEGKWHKRIRILRCIHDWSIRELAEKCITTEKCVWSWEAGRSIPSNRNKKKIASVLGVEEEVIFK